MKKLILILSVVISLSSCSEYKMKKNVENLIKSYKTAVEKSDSTMIDSLYKGSLFHKKYEINDTLVNIIKVNDTTIIAEMKDDKRFIINNKDNKYKIVNSHKLYNFIDEVEYLILGERIKIINPKRDTLDNELYDRIIKTMFFLTTKTSSIKYYLENSIIIKNKTASSGYGSSISGNFIVKNLTSFSIPKLKYTITYLDRNGNIITEDDDYVSYGTLESYSSQSVSFYTSYVPNCSKYRIELNISYNLIRDYVIESYEYDKDDELLKEYI